MDKSHGYEDIAAIFIKGRGQAVNGVGASSVRNWAKTLPRHSIVLDIGCGTGIPVSKILIREGFTVYGLDASPSMVEAFKQNFPGNRVACEAAEDSSFFDLKFDAVISWGLLFLLPQDAQGIVIRKAAGALKRGGKFLFTSPPKPVHWDDAMTGQPSMSLGAEKYRELLEASGLSLIEEFEDEGENHYYHSVKT